MLPLALGGRCVRTIVAPLPVENECFLLARSTGNPDENECLHVLGWAITAPSILYALSPTQSLETLTTTYARYPNAPRHGF